MMVCFILNQEDEEMWHCAQWVTSIAIQEGGIAAVHLQALFAHYEHGDLCAVLAFHKHLCTTPSVPQGEKVLIVADDHRTKHQCRSGLVLDRQMSL